MPLDIQTPFIGDALSRLLRLTSGVKVGLESFVVPTIVVADLAHCSEPPICRSAACAFFIGNVAAERCAFRMTCPPGTICEVKRLWLAPESADLLVLRPIRATDTALVLTAQTAPIPRWTDQRLEPAFTPQDPGLAFEIGTTATLPAVTQFSFEQRLPASTGAVIEPSTPWIIAPGQAWDCMVYGTVNNDLNACLEWVEYQVV